MTCGACKFLALIGLITQHTHDTSPVYQTSALKYSHSTSPIESERIWLIRRGLDMPCIWLYYWKECYAGTRYNEAGPIDKYPGFGILNPYIFIFTSTLRPTIPCSFCYSSAGCFASPYYTLSDIFSPQARSQTSQCHPLCACPAEPRSKTQADWLKRGGGWRAGR